MEQVRFLVKKHAIQQTELIESELLTEEQLKEGEILLSVEKFALTANNITYAVTGSMIGYWQFYPVDNDWGIIPAWGFAKVLASKHESLATGTRLYGFLPMGNQVVLKPGDLRPNGFSDISEHRKALPPVYNFYNLVNKDRSLMESSEEMTMIFRPLFTTSFLLDYFLAQHEFFQAKQIFIPSASSKTGFALAFMLYEAKKNNNLDIEIVGFTSERNQEFVKSLGFYDHVFTYNKLENIPIEDSYIVDFSGNHNLLMMLQQKLGGHHKGTTLVGLSHWEEQNQVRAEGKVFFAPDWVTKINEDWGYTKFQEQLGIIWQKFAEHSIGKMQFNISKGNTELQKTYQEVLKGQVPASSAYVVEF